jgi:hypothetical protein
MGLDPQIPFADGGKDGRLGDGVWVEVVKLHPIVMRERRHKADRRHPKPPLVERGEAHHVARRWRRFLFVARREPLELRPMGAGVKLKGNWAYTFPIIDFGV